MFVAFFSKKKRTQESDMGICRNLFGFEQVMIFLASENIY